MRDIPIALSQRHEAKLVLPLTQLHRVSMWLRVNESEFDPAYTPRWVNNIYFDTEELDAYNDTVEGAGRRVKVRLRWYGDQQPVMRGTLEFKCKVGGMGWKRSCPLDEPIDLTQSWRSIAGQLRRLLPQEHRLIFNQVNRPTLINRYHRAYYISFDRAVRITLDTHIHAWSQTMGLRPNLRRRLRLDDYVVLEFKADRRATRLLSDAIHALGCRVDKHSKYATGLSGVAY